MGFMDTLFGNTTKVKTSARAPSKAEKTVSGVLAKESEASLPLFQQILAQQKQQTGFNDNLFNQMSGQQAGFNSALSPQDYGKMQAGWLQSVNQLGQTDQDILGKAMAMIGQGTGATPEQIELIKQAADAATQYGLSDLSKFQNDAFHQIQQLAAGRGLRPMDTPILNQFGQTGEEYGRQAQQLVLGMRQNQLEQQLAYPLQAGQYGMQQLTTASDLANRRAQFQANLASEANQNQLNYGRGITATGLGLAQGSDGGDSLGPLVSQRQFQSGNVNQVATPSPASVFGSMMKSPMG